MSDDYMKEIQSKSVEDIKKDIKNLNIQGATNVAIATVEGIKKFLKETDEKEKGRLKVLVEEVGKELSTVRPNEPLARNCVTYIEFFSKRFEDDLPDTEAMKHHYNRLLNNYLDLISFSKKQLIINSAPMLKNLDNILTHCHSSTVVELIYELSKKDKTFEVVCTETRPLYQGRTTAKRLLEYGINTTLIADSAAESFVIGRGSVPVEMILIGADQITKDGYVINKIGSWGIAMSAYYSGKPIYVVSPLLKVDTDMSREEIKIEIREDRELWDTAPKNLKMFNPAFEIIEKNLITGYVTEFGILKASDIEKVIAQNYNWLNC